MDLILQPLASSYAVLTEDEKELGVCVVDIGGGTTDIAVFTQGAIRHTAVLPVAGDQITNDIAMALRTPTSEAEELKIQKGVALHTLADSDEMVEVPGVGDRPPRKLSRQALANVIEPRVVELFELVQAELRRSGYEELLSSGIVLTGGSSVMAGMEELGESIFNMPVRVGAPQYEGGLADVVCQPYYSAAMGLIMEGMAQRRRGIMARDTRSVWQMFGKMKAWFQKNF
jgi:cell division protein FtsA